MKSDLAYLLPHTPSAKIDIDQLLRIKADRELAIDKDLEFLHGLPASKKDGAPFSGHFAQDIVSIGSEEDLHPLERERLRSALTSLIPWKKGPFNLFGIDLDAEWKCQLKWNRISPHIDNLQGKTVLDIGCNNGHYMFRMAAQGPRMVLGIDPVKHNYLQFRLIQHFAQAPNIHFELFEAAHLPLFQNYFDTIFSMGIIYHHRNPLEQLQWIHQAMRPGGQLILESIAIPGHESVCLFPEDRYAKMKNVWFLPTSACLVNWLRRTHFSDIEILSVTPSSAEEQRLTAWCPPPRESYSHFIDPNDAHKTVEGHPAPLRVAIRALKKR